jgi:hypothetical protein
MITFMTDTIGDTIAGVATKNRLSIGTIFSVIKRTGSQVYSSHSKAAPYLQRQACAAESFEGPNETSGQARS